MIVDFDDFHEHHHHLSLLQTLRDVNPLFRCTLFAIPALGTETFWDSVPEWCELAAHGYTHSDVYEVADWSREAALDVLLSVPDRFVEGFKAPGWQISTGTYQALTELNWWVADHWDNDAQRPDGIMAHVITPAAGAGMDPNHWHGHIGNVCGNGIQETFPELLRRVREATSFELVSESVSAWRAKVTA
jgi:hypothetical protein